MKTYNVTVPCTMAVCVTVEAESEEAAIEAAFDIGWLTTVTPFGEADKAAAPEVIEIELHRRIVEGNVFHGCINEIKVDEKT